MGANTKYSIVNWLIVCYDKRWILSSPNCNSTVLSA